MSAFRSTKGFVVSARNRLRERTKPHRHFLRFKRGIRKALTVPEGKAFPNGAIAAILESLGVCSLDPQDPFLRSSLEAATAATGNILKCGADVVGLMLGIVAHRNGQTLWILEHDRHWYEVMRGWIDQYGIRRTHVIYAPAELCTGYVWYSIDTKRLPKPIALVICGGDSLMPSGLLGVLERAGPRLGHRGTILCSNVKRCDDRQRALNWAKSLGAACVVVKKPNRPSYLKIALPDRRPRTEFLEDRLMTAYESPTAR